MWNEQVTRNQVHIPGQYADYAQNDIPLNPRAQQLFHELGKKIDDYPAVCSAGLTARVGLPSGRISFGGDLNTSKGLRSAVGVRLFSVKNTNSAGETTNLLQGSFSVKNGRSPQNVTLSASIPGTPLRAGVSTNDNGITGVNVGGIVGSLLNIQGNADISNAGDRNCK